MKLRRLKKISFVLLFLLLSQLEGMAQCAMCRVSVENSVSANSDNFAAGLNTGILYLFVMPYLAITIIGYLWYRANKKNAAKVQNYFDR